MPCIPNSNLTPQERCDELVPHFTPVVDCDKIFVEWDGTGCPDVINYELYQWNGTDRVILDTIVSEGPNFGGVFSCIPEGEYSILQIACIYDQVLEVGCGCGVITSSILCCKYYDRCNCFNPCVFPQTCIDGFCAEAVSAEVNCGKDCNLFVLPLLPTNNAPSGDDHIDLVNIEITLEELCPPFGPDNICSTATVNGMTMPGESYATALIRVTAEATALCQANLDAIPCRYAASISKLLPCSIFPIFGTSAFAWNVSQQAAIDIAYTDWLADKISKCP